MNNKNKLEEWYSIASYHHVNQLNTYLTNLNYIFLVMIYFFSNSVEADYQEYRIDCQVVDGRCTSCPLQRYLLRRRNYMNGTAEF